MKLLYCFLCQGYKVAIVQTHDGIAAAYQAIPFWVRIQGFAYTADGQGKWIWANKPCDEDDTVESWLLTQTWESSQTVEVDIINRLLCKSLLCKHRSGRWLLYEPIQYNIKDREIQAQERFNLNLTVGLRGPRKTFRRPRNFTARSESRRRK